MLYIVGLGNPGTKYLKTRHNIGAMILEKLRDNFGFPDFVDKKTLQAFVSEASIHEEPVMFVFPQTFMNLSGVSVAKICRNMKPNDILLVLYDDLDIPLGQYKLSYAKSAGGHNGVASIIEHLGSKAFLRLRIGIAQVSEEGKAIRSGFETNQSDYVLATFRPEEKEKISLLFPKIKEVISSLVREGREKTVSKLG